VGGCERKIDVCMSIVFETSACAMCEVGGCDVRLKMCSAWLQQCQGVCHTRQDVKILEQGTSVAKVRD